jgi:hypothetical protein
MAPVMESELKAVIHGRKPMAVPLAYYIKSVAGT